MMCFSQLWGIDTSGYQIQVLEHDYSRQGAMYNSDKGDLNQVYLYVLVTKGSM